MDIRLFAQGATGLDPNLLAEIQEGMHEGGYTNSKTLEETYKTDMNLNGPVIDAKDNPYAIAKVVLWLSELGVGWSACKRPTKGIGDYSCGMPQGQRLIRG